MSRAALALVFAFATCAQAAPPEDAAADRAGEVRKRLEALRAEEARLAALREPSGRDEPAPEPTTFPAGAPFSPRPVSLTANARATPAGAADFPLPNEGEIAFERARLEAVRAKLEAVRLRLRKSREETAAREKETAPLPSVSAPDPFAEKAGSLPGEKTALVESTPSAPSSVSPDARAKGFPHAAEDPLRLGDALLATGDAAHALEAYEAAAVDADRRRDSVSFARARYGVGRALERLGRSNEAKEVYSSLEALAASGVWAQAAAFARKFLEWKEKLDRAGEIPERNRSHRAEKRP
jgi:tetratricopeptide (TPR) repeat protein